ncbi:MAG: hypothetical protein R3D71_04575 [Rickettsiales bacterium]
MTQKKTSKEVMREAIKKDGKITPETFKKLMDMKISEAKARIASGEGHKFSMGGQLSQNRKRSKSAEKTMELMAMMELEKEMKKERKRVEIEVRGFINGRINKKGDISDQMGNVVAKVNLKNGMITTIYGQMVGQYKPKSYPVVSKIVDIINKNSPYLANQRKAEEARKAGGNIHGPATPQGVNVWSSTGTDVWGNSSSTNAWGVKTDAWGRTLSDSWGNQQLDAWGNQI